MQLILRHSTVLRKSLLVLLIVLFSGSIVIASDLDGIWNLTFIHDGDAHAEVISLKIEGNQVSGKWWKDEIHGTVSGDEIRLDFMRGDSRDPDMNERTKKTVIEARIYDRKVMMGTIVVTGSSNWNAPLLLTRARVVEPGSGSELDGSWNVHIHMEAKSQPMLGEIWPLVFHLRVDDTKVTGFLWDQHVYGIFKDGELILDFPHYNQLFTDDFRLQTRVKDGKLVGTWQHGLLYGSCNGVKANSLGVE